MTVKVYDEYVELSDRDSDYVRNVMDVHAQIYNQALDVLIQNPEMDFGSLKKTAREIITKLSVPLGDEFLAYIESVLFNELHYLFTRFRRKKAQHRKNNEIAYMTLRKTDFCSSHDALKLNFKYFRDNISLPVPLPTVKSPSYFNLSFSPQDSRFKLAVFN